MVFQLRNSLIHATTKEQCEPQVHDESGETWLHPYLSSVSKFSDKRIS